MRPSSANSTRPIRAGQGRGRAHEGGFLVASAEPEQSSAPRLPSDGTPAAHQALVGSAAIRQVGRYRVSSGVPVAPGAAGRGGASSRRWSGHRREPARCRSHRGTAGATRPRPIARRAARKRHGYGGLCLGDDHHAGRMGVRTEGDKRPCLVLVGGRAGYGREAAEWASRLARKRYSQKGVTRRFVQNRTLSGQGLEHRTNFA
jgi:hypothetical protein